MRDQADDVGSRSVRHRVDELLGVPGEPACAPAPVMWLRAVEPVVVLSRVDVEARDHAGHVEHGVGGLALLGERVVVQPGRDLGVLVREGEVARRAGVVAAPRRPGSGRGRSRSSRLVSLPSTSCSPTGCRSNGGECGHCGFVTPSTPGTPRNGRPVCAAWSAVITIRVSSSSPSSSGRRRSCRPARRRSSRRTAGAASPRAIRAAPGSPLVLRAPHVARSCRCRRG